MRALLVEAAQTATRVEPNLRRHYQRLKFRKASAVSKVAIARKLAVRLYWMRAAKLTRRSWFACKVARGLTWWTYIHRISDGWPVGWDLSGKFTSMYL
jgi:hypothetical protein